MNEESFCSRSRGWSGKPLAVPSPRFSYLFSSLYRIPEGSVASDICDIVTGGELEERAEASRGFAACGGCERTETTGDVPAAAEPARRREAIGPVLCSTTTSTSTTIRWCGVQALHREQETERRAPARPRERAAGDRVARAYARHVCAESANIREKAWPTSL